MNHEDQIMASLLDKEAARLEHLAAKMAAQVWNSPLSESGEMWRDIDRITADAKAARADAKRLRGTCIGIGEETK